MRVAPRSLTVDGERLGDDLGGAGGIAFDRAGAGQVADGTKAHRQRLDRFARRQRRQISHRNEQAAPAHDLASVRVVEPRQAIRSRWM